MADTEIWKDIYYTDSISGEVIDYRGKYQISNLGRCRNIAKNKFMNLNDLGNGYMRVHLHDRATNNYKKILIHRIVAHMFIPNPNNYPIVNHKDENPQNNCVYNLEWCSYSYNVRYNDNRNKVAKKLSIPVIQTDMDGNFIKEWCSAKQAARELHLFSNSITACCKGKINSTGGHKFRYAS